jgi:hypothetical protein
MIVGVEGVRGGTYYKHQPVAVEAKSMNSIFRFGGLHPLMAFRAVLPP